jgi:hypothetical protein
MMMTKEQELEATIEDLLIKNKKLREDIEYVLCNPHHYCQTETKGEWIAGFRRGHNNRLERFVKRIR